MRKEYNTKMGLFFLLILSIFFPERYFCGSWISLTLVAVVEPSAASVKRAVGIGRCDGKRRRRQTGRRREAVARRHVLRRGPRGESIMTVRIRPRAGERPRKLGLLLHLNVHHHHTVAAAARVRRKDAFGNRGRHLWSPGERQELRNGGDGVVFLVVARRPDAERRRAELIRQALHIVIRGGASAKGVRLSLGGQVGVMGHRVASQPLRRIVIQQSEQQRQKVRLLAELIA